MDERNVSNPVCAERDRTRKLWGLTLPDVPEDPSVMSRRRYHEAAAKWLAKWSYPLQAFFATAGFVVVLLPMFSKSWRAVVESAPIAGGMFNDFSTLSGWAMLLFLSLMTMFLILNWKVNDYPGGWHPTKQRGFPNPRQVVEMELYPRTHREEFVFWIGIVFGAVGTTIWTIFCGVFAFFINIGG